MIRATRGIITADKLSIEVDHGRSQPPELVARIASGANAETVADISPIGVEASKSGTSWAHFALPDTRPLRSVVLMTRVAGQLAKIEPSGSCRLDNLLPTKSKDLSNLIFHRSTRIKEPETLRFVLEQIYRSPQNNYFERIESVKIMSYQALETVNLPALQTCLDQTKKAMTWVPHLPDEFGIAKTSRYQARISLLYLRYLLRLFIGDFRGVLKELRTINNSVGFVAECPIAAYNLVLALLMRGYLLAQSGDYREANECWSEVIRIFRAAAANMPSRTPATFVELSVSLESAKLAAFAIAELRLSRHDPATGITIERLARSFSRLRQPDAQAFFQQQVEAMIHGMKSVHGLPVDSLASEPVKAS